MNKITKLRERAGLTQSALAEATGINIRQIQKYESGEYDIEKVSLKNAILLARELKCNTEDLIGSKGARTTSKAALRWIIKAEYSDLRKWQALDRGNIGAMKLDLSDGDIWSDCLREGEFRKYKSEDIVSIPWEVEYGYHVDEMEREFLDNAVALLEAHGWTVED